MAEINNKYILHIAEWFPNSEDPQLGIFIVKHIKAINSFAKCLTVVIAGDNKLQEKFKIEKKHTFGLDVLMGTYKQYSGWKKFINRWNYWCLLFHLMKRLEQKPTAIHVHVPRRSTFFVKYFTRKWQCPYFISDHWHGWLEKSYLPSKNRKSFYKNAQLVTAVSQVLASAIQKKTAAKVQIIPNVVPEITIINNQKQQKRIIVVADLVDGTKNISGILSSFKNFKSKQKDWQLDIIGDGPDTNKLKLFVQSQGISDVHFLGRWPNDRVLEAYKNYDFLISFSNYETFGLTIAEALAAGIPVIATRCGGPESFVNNNNGILISPRDVAALSKAIQTMADNKNAYRPKELQESVAQFQEAAITKTFYDSYKKLIDVE